MKNTCLKTTLSLVALFLAFASLHVHAVTFKAQIASYPDNDPAVELFTYDINFWLEDMEINADDLPDGYYLVYDNTDFDIRWTVNDDVYGTGSLAFIFSGANRDSSPTLTHDMLSTIPEDALANVPIQYKQTGRPLGNNVITQKGQYTITFSGVLHYRVAWFDGVEHTGPEQQVALTALPGGSLSRNFIYFTMEFVTPAGDPETQPDDSGDGQNEFTFSPNIPGVLTMPLKVSTDPSTAAQYVTDRVTFEVASVGTANPSYTPVGASNGCLVCTATVTGMPTNNSDFGKKVASVKYRGTVNKSTYYEVFFPRDATNHPSTSNNSDWENWYYYWRQNGPNTSNVIIERSLTMPNNQIAKATGMADWSDTQQPIKNKILINVQRLPTSGYAYGVGEYFSGIDHFYDVIRHEMQHVNQIYNFDMLVDSLPQTCFMYGWSWNQSTHNHWNKGNDNKWGIANVDDDGNNQIDDAAIVPPFEPGHGDDNPLAYDSIPEFRDWPYLYILPYPFYSNIGAVESDAINVSQQSHIDNIYNYLDWGNPGKNHKTINNWND